VLLQQARVDAPEVDRHLEVVIAVEPVEVGVVAVNARERAVALHPGQAAGAVVGAAVVLLGPPAELRPHERERAVGDTARLEVGLERRQALADIGQDRRQLRLVVVGVEVAVGLHVRHADAEWLGDHRGEVAQPPPEVAVGVGDA
jgi:hypothetical protein